VNRENKSNTNKFSAAIAGIFERYTYEYRCWTSGLAGRPAVLYIGAVRFSDSSVNVDKTVTG
jgi:hypothetical protein